MEPLIQYDLFQETTDEDVLKAEVAALKDSHHAVRKKTFAQIGTLTKMIMDQQHEIDFLKVKLGLACSVVKPLEILENEVKKKRGRKSVLKELRI